jgi:hypothetical protein
MIERSLGQEQGQGTVGGGWLGTYAYAVNARRVRFEATFTEPDAEGRFAGTILDDGSMNEADVSGGQGGRGVRFSKTYKKKGLTPVSYEGTLSDDGRTMGGTWRIANSAHGDWDARRLWSAGESSAALSETDDLDRAQTEEKEDHVREVVRLG